MNVLLLINYSLITVMVVSLVFVLLVVEQFLLFLGAVMDNISLQQQNTELLLDGVFSNSKLSLYDELMTSYECLKIKRGFNLY